MTEIFTGFGEKGRSAESVADGAAAEAATYLTSGVPVGPHLADRLLLLMAIAGEGAMVSLPPTPHSETQLEVIARFLELEVRSSAPSPRSWRVEIG